MPRSPRKGPKPHSIRFTYEERRELDELAAGMSWAAYIKSCIPFKGNAGHRRRARGQFPVKNIKALAALLALLGRWNIAANLNEIVRLARNGSLPITPELEALLRTACRDIAAVKVMLMQALGKKER